MKNYKECFPFIIVILIGFFVSGCVTSYQPLGFGGGYSEKKIDKNKYFLRYEATKDTRYQLVEEYWFRRATELCGSENFETDMGGGFGATDTFIPAGGVLVPKRYYNRPVIEGVVRCK